MATLSAAQYQPGPVPSNVADLPRYLQEEFAKIAAALAIVGEGNYSVSYKEPARKQVGMVRYFDGAQVNPGGGEGLYLLKTGGAWTKIG